MVIFDQDRRLESWEQRRKSRGLASLPAGPGWFNQADGGEKAPNGRC